MLCITGSEAMFADMVSYAQLPACVACCDCSK